MEVQINKLSQDLNLRTGETENYAVIELPNGGIIKARINEEAAVAITDCLVHGEVSQRRPDQDVAYASAPGKLAAVEVSGEAAQEFGEEVTPKRHATRVSNLLDPGEMSGGFGVDEDGVGQV